MRRCCSVVGLEPQARVIFSNSLKVASYSANSSLRFSIGRDMINFAPGLVQGHE